MVITTRSSCYDESVAAIVCLPPEEWAQAGKAAVEKEGVSSRKGSEKLAELLSASFEAAAKEHEEIANILRQEIDLDSTNITFSIFRTFKFAQMMKNNHNVLGQLKTQVQNTSYNVGFNNCCELLDTIAENPSLTLAGIQIACDLSDEQKVPGKCSLRECLTAMDYLVRIHYADIYRVFEEYRSVPRQEKDGEGKEDGRRGSKRTNKRKL